jgi:asparagine synthase (glutamine-hydrolysing)
MCGIIGDASGMSAEEAGRMLERVSHRGPDDWGSVRAGGAYLGHRRLSIVDVDGGHQPLSAQTDTTTLYLVGNGEVYNHETLRESLADASLSTRSDNEVALRLVAERGPGALSELLGMFAFLIAGEDGTFIAARDPVGIKPLYWARRDGSVRFASEMRAFDEDWRPYVASFPPGHYWTPEGGLVRFGDAVPEELEPIEGPSEPGAPVPDEILDGVRQRLIEAVERQMMGDVPVGVFLSGGLDSSLVAAIAARWYERRGERLKTFAVGLEDSPDLLAARAVAEHLGTEHHERLYTAQEALDLVPEVVRVIESFDPSLVRSAVPNYMLAEFAARHVKVVLTGEGADEIFAGYDYLQEFATEADLHEELVRTLEGLHDLNLQRCDRVTMAHGLEARVPFLELDMISLGLSLPAGWKLAGRDQPEKRLLRLAFDGWLPHDFLWRKKAQFGDGSGAASVLQERMENTVTPEDFERDKDLIDPPLRTREELAYYRIFAEALGEVRPNRTVGRFATA